MYFIMLKICNIYNGIINRNRKNRSVLKFPSVSLTVAVGSPPYVDK